MGLIFYGVLLGFWLWDLGYSIIGCFIIGNSSILFGFLYLDAFWILSLGLCMDFIFFSF